MVYHNFQNYDSSLISQESGKYDDFKISVKAIPKTIAMLSNTKAYLC